MLSLSTLFGLIIIFASFVFVWRTIRETVRSGEFKNFLMGNFKTYKLAPAPTDESEALNALFGKSARDKLAASTNRFEEAASMFQEQVRTGFRFFIVFASLGYLTLVTMAFFHQPGSGGSTFAQFIAGMVMIGLSTVFFSKSKNAHQSMVNYLEEWRNRERMEKCKVICENVSDETTRDALRIQLSLYYAGIKRPLPATKAIVESCLRSSKNPDGVSEA